jgi:predicted secreted protein
MQFVSGLLVFVVGWWMCFMMVLPLGVRAQDEDDEGKQQNIVEGTVPSAPAKPKILLKMGLATIGAIIIWALIYYLVIVEQVQ